jgi:hypothetical protein
VIGLFGASAPTIRRARCAGEPLATSLSAVNSSRDQLARLSLRLATAFRVAASTVAPGTWLDRLSLARRQRRRRDAGEPNSVALKAFHFTVNPRVRGQPTWRATSAT